ncbi:cytochrome c553 [Roseibium hamelinense]|uniref:Cytochrome c553 n=1 Tax=Roseibium hamelinense TaxID=150831 RepID=A0A562SXH2_9HYPH|nr:c-type cytochrome [Roseibium hamelinense]MTI44791.1 hypothetical protein [Roseibium hamelinense]TWI86017.1 cytochrome c553 [Roseibium hamelinense]
MGLIKNALLGIGVLTVAGGVIGGGLALSGLISLKASEPHGIGAYNLLHFVFKRYVSTHALELTPPADLGSQGRVALGAQHFAMVCSNCHGGPNIGQSATSLSIRPRPQFLPEVVDEFSDEELFVILKYGVKFSAMPSWPTQDRDDDVWTMVSFVRGLPDMTGEAYAQLISVSAPAGATWPKPSYQPGTIPLEPSNTARNTFPAADYNYAAPATGLYDERISSDPVAVCARCHGYDGSGEPTLGEAPNLSLQEARYLEAALKAFASGERKSGFMQQAASQLSPDQITVLAQYFASQPVTYLADTPSSMDAATQTAYDRGKDIGENGIEATRTPACQSCHLGQRPSEAAPIIHGQNQPYLARQLTQFKNGGRGNDGSWNPMMSEAHNLTDADIEGLAVYYSRQQMASQVQ